MQKVQEMQARSLAREVPLEKEMATHSSILAWEIPWTEEPDGLQSMGFQKSDVTNHHHHTLNANFLSLLIVVWLQKSATLFLRKTH